MTPKYTAWLDALATRNANLTSLALIAAALVLAWLLLDWLIRHKLIKDSMGRELRWFVLVIGVPCYYILTILFTVREGYIQTILFTR